MSKGKQPLRGTSIAAHPGGSVDFHIDNDAQTSREWVENHIKPSVFGPKWVGWSDGSLSQADKSHGGAGVYWLRLNGLDPTWITKHGGQESFAVQGEDNFDSGCTELLGTYCALSIAYWEVLDWLQRDCNQTTLGKTKPRSPPTVTVLTDSEDAINYLKGRHRQEKTPLLDIPANWFHELMRPLDSLLSLGCHVTIRWLKGHSGIKGNERADSLAIAGRMLSEQISRDIGVKNGVSLFSLSALVSHGVLQHIPSLNNIWEAKITIPASAGSYGGVELIEGT
ncbi:hypothetical protein F5Y18DRAFT_408458 [Xylariaceae sp. FL1019]|nr:hypothetical protein F5Y18DRAFT_408458 [Xylariaceae sp. FL1019]